MGPVPPPSFTIHSGLRLKQPKQLSKFKTTHHPLFGRMQYEIPHIDFRSARQNFMGEADGPQFWLGGWIINRKTSRKKVRILFFSTPSTFFKETSSFKEKPSLGILLYGV